MTASEKTFIIKGYKKGDSEPYYATQEGFEHFNPFQAKPFSQKLLSFGSESAALKFIEQHPEYTCAPIPFNFTSRLEAEGAEKENYTFR